MAKTIIPIVVGVVKNNQGQLLIGKRKDKNIKEADSLWEPLGGHIEFGEDPEQSIKREIKEESGLEIKVLRLLPKIYNNFWRTKDGEELQTVLLSYECLVTGGQLHTENFDEKIAELKFINIKDFERYNFLPRTKEIFDLINS